MAELHAVHLPTQSQTNFDAIGPQEVPVFHLRVVPDLDDHLVRSDAGGDVLQRRGLLRDCFRVLNWKLLLRLLTQLEAKEHRILHGGDLRY